MGDEDAVYADKAYESKERRERLHARGVKDRIRRRGAKGREQAIGRHGGGDFCVSGGAMDDVITMEEIGRVYEVTDGLGIDRESLSIELGKEDPGGWTRASGGMTRGEVVAITLPLTTPLDDWLPSLEAGLRELVGDTGFPLSRE